MKLEETKKKAVSNALKDVNGEAFLYRPKKGKDADSKEVEILIFSKEDPLEVSREVAQRYFLFCEEKLDVIVMDPDRLSKEQEAFLDSINREPLA